MSEIGAERVFLRVHTCGCMILVFEYKNGGMHIRTDFFTIDGQRVVRCPECKKELPGGFLRKPKSQLVEV
jgi:hypothetical protein